MSPHANNHFENSSDNGIDRKGESASAAAGLDLVSLAGPQDSARAVESAKHLRDIKNLAGDAPKNPVAQDSEALLLRAGASFAPTPNNLGSEGCMAAISTNVLKPLSDKYHFNIPYFQDSRAFLKFMQGHPQIADVYKVKIGDLTNEDIKPGDIVVGTKSDGNHAMGWARVPANWHWNNRDMIAVGNTGLPEFGKPAMRLAQEYIGPTERSQYEEEHNNHHGMINSRSANNPYRVAGGAQFVIVRFKNPDGSPSLDGPPPHAHR